MKYLVTSVLSCIAVGLLLEAPAIAKTPDGVTPANEGVCDALTTATPGLYGLCVAYCEAQDYDATDLNNPRVDRQIPSNRILDNYNKKKKAGDPDMPCVKQPCPCWDAAEFDHITLTAHWCITEDSFIEADEIFRQDNSVTHRVRTYDLRDPTPKRCVFTDLDSSHSIYRKFSITDEEYEMCRSQIVQRGTEMSLIGASGTMCWTN